MINLKKYLFLIILFTLNSWFVQAQNNDDFKEEWKKIEAFDAKGLPKSAQAVALDIFNRAIKSENSAQQIKAAMHLMKYRNQVEEENRENNIFYLDTLIAQTKAPAKNILQSMQAELFNSYLQNNRYKLYNRTALTEEKSKDIRTWSFKKLQERTTALYEASLQPATILQQQPIEKWSPILITGANTRKIRPTLYDLLANRALQFYMVAENYTPQPVFKFVIDNPKYLADVNTFLGLTIETKDTSSLELKALKLFQKLLSFHAGNKNDAAVAEVNLDRLDFVYNNAVFTGKEETYEKSLLEIAKNNQIPELIAGAEYRLSNLYFQKGNEYQPLVSTKNRYQLKKAAELAASTYKKFPETDAGKQAYNLYQQIIQPRYSLQSEEVVVPNQPFKSLLNYKNTGKLYFKIVKISREELEALNKIRDTNYESYWKRLGELKALKTFTISPPETGDYQNHAVEFKVDALSNGTYLMISSLNENFSIANNILVNQLVQVSDIAYFKQDREIYVVNRNSGKPLAGATLQTWVSKYNNSIRQNEKLKAEKYNADKNGYIKISAGTKQENYNYQFFYNDDELFTNDSHYNYYNNYNPPRKKEKKQSFLFTDRAIYRPGQTIFFKGILVSSDSNNKNHKVIAKDKVKITLYDANRQKVNTLELTSNEYGSYTGSFVIPEGLLNGNFNITEEGTKSYKHISVEEYKRPKFSVDIKKPLGSYRLNDDITVTGNAKAFAGNNIDGASVSYRVVRKVRYPIWYGWGRSYWPPMGSGEEMEIANGTTITDAQGNFEVKFKAIPDESVAKENQPTFNYEIVADVTDINGETHSNTQTVSVAYQALQINVLASNKINKDSLQQIKISSSNMNGLFEPATVHFEMYSLTEPTTVYKNRYWQVPDTFLMSKKEHDQYFPFDPYSNENEISSWTVGRKVLETTQKTNEDNKFNLPTTKLTAGWYKIIISTKDKYGEPVKAEKYIEVTDNKINSTNRAIVLEVPDFINEPGNEVTTKITTGFDEIYLLHLLNREDEITKEIKSISKNKSLVNIYKITENDLGGFSINYVFVKHNRIYTGSQTISIPWKKKALDISYENFRDKLLPGSEEKWTIHVTGDKKDKVAAEMLLGMYDASLDEFVPHSWSSLNGLWPNHYPRNNWRGETFGQTSSTEFNKLRIDYKTLEQKIYDQLANNGWNEGYNQYYYYRNQNKMASAAPVMDAEMNEVVTIENALAGKAAGISIEQKQADTSNSESEKNQPPKINADIPVRKNLQETAFFFPQLQTDKDGNLSFSFTMPEALTAWKMMALAHTKDLASGYNEKMLVTQKPLMVQPNAPRFLREGDQMEFSAKIVNLTGEEITGTAQLELMDAVTNNPVDGYFNNIFPSQYFTVAAGASAVVQFPINVPINFGSALYYRIKAISKDGQFSDGEASALPVLTNRMLVTETLPLNMRQAATKQFTFEKLLNSANSGSLSHQSLTVEYSSNPAWYAVQALPYLMEYPYDCAEQTFNKYYANALAENIVKNLPKIKAVFDKWNSTDTAALLSNLQKNEELKSALLQETPWVLQAKSETQQKKNIALLFQMSRLAKEQASSLQKLIAMQNPDGSFPWFKGGPSDRFITQYIITGIGRLQILGAISSEQMATLKPIVNKAMVYLDEQIKKDYDYLIKYKADLKKDQLGNTAIQYLYMRSLFTDQSFYKDSKVAYDFYFGQSKKYWVSKTKYLQGMIAISLNKNKEVSIAKEIIKSLKENSINNEEMGMYWKDYANRNYYWYQAPIESQALLIEAFTEVDKNPKTIDDLKTWLLKQKQTQNWQSTKATADAVYALLLGGSNWIAEEREVSIQLGNYTVDSKDQKQEAGTGYFKEVIPANKVQASMGNILVNIKESGNKKSTASSWGAVYWHYFEELDKITSAETPLSLTKKLFIEKNTATGPILEAIQEGDDIKVGDKIKIRITLKSDRDMEYVHMKDMRASSFEPVNVLSSFKYQGGLGYYESTKDASTQFFFSQLPKGTYVFEYDLFASQKGNFSNGVTTIQCMYAPEFTSHSEGVRVKVK